MRPLALNQKPTLTRWVGPCTTRPRPSLWAEMRLLVSKTRQTMLTFAPSPSRITGPKTEGAILCKIIIAQDDGIRNVSFHRQFLRDENHLVVRLVPRHLRTMVMNAREEGREVNIAVVNAPDPVVLLAAAMSFNENIDELTIAAALHEKLYGTTLHLVEMPNGVQVPRRCRIRVVGKNHA